MIPRLRIGNQTAIACAERMEPFEFALRHGFGAFEWFADKKENPGGSAAGWDESDMDQGLRLDPRHRPGPRHPLHRPRALAGQPAAPRRGPAVDPQRRFRP